MSEIIERAARGLAEKHGARVSRGLAQDFTQWDRRRWSDTWGDYVADVRIALNAIREPSEAMLDAARAEADAAGTAIRQHEIEGIYRAMIDAALGEKA